MPEDQRLYTVTYRTYSLAACESLREASQLKCARKNNVGRGEPFVFALPEQLRDARARARYIKMHLECESRYREARAR